MKKGLKVICEKVHKKIIIMSVFILSVALIACCAVYLYLSKNGEAEPENKKEIESSELKKEEQETLEETENKKLTKEEQEALEEQEGVKYVEDDSFELDISNRFDK